MKMGSIGKWKVSTAVRHSRTNEAEEHEAPWARRPMALITWKLIFAAVRVLHEWVSTRGNGF